MYWGGGKSSTEITLYSKNVRTLTPDSKKYNPIPTLRGVFEVTKVEIRTGNGQKLRFSVCSATVVQPCITKYRKCQFRPFPVRISTFCTSETPLNVKIGFYITECLVKIGIFLLNKVISALLFPTPQYITSLHILRFFHARYL